MTLSAETLDEIQARVRGGFDDRDRIVEVICEEMYEPGQVNPEEVETEVARAFAAKREEKKRWPKVTDCDRLDAVFAALDSRGIVSLQNAGYTQSDGYDDVLYALEQRGQPSNVVGYCFYHGQDLERAVRGLGLYLAFGPVDPKLEESEGPKVGAAVVEELQKEGFKAVWDGTFDQRIFVPEIDWKKR